MHLDDQVSSELRRLVTRIERVEARLESYLAEATGIAARTWDVVTKLAFPIAALALGWIWNIDRVVLANGQRDEIYRQAFVEDHVRLNQRLAELPPERLLDQVAKLAHQNEQILQRLAAVEAKLDR